MRNPDRRPYVPPVKKITLSEASPKLRVVLIILCLVIAAAALAAALNGLLRQEDGWQEIEAAASKRNLSEEFVLRYDFSRSGARAPADRRALSDLYTEVMEQSYVIFSKDEETEGNLWWVNVHANEAVTVDPVLYDALETVQRCGSRYLYLAPAYEEYRRIFLCETAEEAASYDPSQDAELADWLQQLADFANDPQHIDLELLGNLQVRLNVSDEYLSFAEEYELESFLDFSWTRNAFVADYAASRMQEKGYTAGYLSSYDGFTRNLDSGNLYSFNVFSRHGNEINLPAVMEYSAPISLVSLRDYAMTEQDRWHYFSFPDSRIVTIFLDPADGRSKSSVHDLVAYSHTADCADVLLQAAPVFVSDGFSKAALQDMTQNGIFAVWSEDTELCFNDSELQLQMKETEKVSYRKSYCE